MSWLSSISLPNPFKSLPDHHDHTGDSHDGGVKDDLSAIGESISRQFRGVASFLAPPPPETADASPSSSAVVGIRNDLAEIGGTFKSFFSNPNKAVSDISKLASDFLLFNQDNTAPTVINDDDYEYEEEDEDELYGGGVNDQVIDFARQICERPELWIDFPLPLDNLDFDMSQEQSEHASIIEQVVPELAHLRNRMTSEKQFWMIYFILLLPRLTAHQIDLLSTPPITQARETLLTMLRTNKCEENNPQYSQSNTSSSLDNKVDDAQSDNSPAIGDDVSTTESDTTRKHDASSLTSTHRDPNPSNEVAAAHKNVDYLPQDEKRFQTEDDVSFSDLEDDDNDIPNRDHSSRSSKIKRNSSTEGSSDWVRLNDGNTKERHGKGQSSWRDRDSEGYESTDWLTVDDFDS